MSVDSTSFDSLLDQCQHLHRRIVLGPLAEERRPLTVNDLTKAVLQNNHHTSIQEASADDLKNVRASLHHIHLPKLAAAGLIHYDSERQVVEATEQSEQVEGALSMILNADYSLNDAIEL